jgi:hypothetical protein
VGIAQRGRAGLLALELRHPRTIATYRPLRFGSLQRKADLVSVGNTAPEGVRFRSDPKPENEAAPVKTGGAFECTSSWRGHAQVQGIRVRTRNVARAQAVRAEPTKSKPCRTP